MNHGLYYISLKSSFTRVAQVLRTDLPEYPVVDSPGRCPSLLHSWKPSLLFMLCEILSDLFIFIIIIIVFVSLISTRFARCRRSHFILSSLSCTILLPPPRPPPSPLPQSLILCSRVDSCTLLGSIPRPVLQDLLKSQLAKPIPTTSVSMLVLMANLAFVCLFHFDLPCCCACCSFFRKDSYHFCIDSILSCSLNSIVCLEWNSESPSS